MVDMYPFLHGGVASIFAEICTYPIDTTKTRLQLQGESSFNNTMKEFKGGHYNGMFHAFQMIIRHEGFSALYRGLNAAVIRQASYGTMKIGIYDKLKKLTNKNKDESLSNNILCAVIAGVLSSTIANPTDVIKVRLQAKSNYNIQSSSFFQEFFQILSKEGFGGLYKAVIPTATRSAVLVGVLLPTYDFSKRVLITQNILMDDISCHFASSLIAATFGTFVSCPVEVIRIRVMNETVPKNNQSLPLYNTKCKYESARDCLKQTIKNERIFALWKGFVPTWFRIGPWNIIFFLSYEQIKKVDLFV